MKSLSILFSFVLILTTATTLLSQIVDRSRPEKWNNLIEGGAFKDRFLPMEGNALKTNNYWGAECVQSRLVDNGIEDDTWSYWGGNIIKGDDGKYHLFVCGWLENSPKGHMEWGNSMIFHTVSDNPSGPFKNLGIVAKGHNPEIFRLSTGEYVLYVINGYYISDDLYGKWKYNKFDWDKRDRKIIEGLSNVTFAKREDGSFVAVCRGGGSWVSKNGISQYNQITDKRAYPPIEGEFEDPVIWKDNVQYNMIVNDWYGRIAFYLRSKDGIDWIVEDGEAYVPGIAKHKDGHIEDWFKFERMKVIQDNHGRATHANFAVCDTLKHHDLPNDKHSSKNIVIPLNKGMLMTIENENPITSKTKNINLKIYTEEEFDAKNDIDFESLRFGSHSLVNYGKGSIVEKVKDCDDGIILIFKAEESGLTTEDFAAKLIGKTKNGQMIYGYARIPDVDYIEPIISTQIQKIENGKCVLKIENFGQIASKESSIAIFNDKELIAEGKIDSIKPYEEICRSLDTSFKPDKDKEYNLTVEIKTNDKITRTENLKLK